MRPRGLGKPSRLGSRGQLDRCPRCNPAPAPDTLDARREIFASIRSRQGPKGIAQSRRIVAVDADESRWLCRRALTVTLPAGRWAEMGRRRMGRRRKVAAVRLLDAFLLHCCAINLPPSFDGPPCPSQHPHRILHVISRRHQAAILDIVQRSSASRPNLDPTATTRPRCPGTTSSRSRTRRAAS